MKHIRLTFSMLILSVFTWQLFITSAHAQWSTDPNVNSVISDATLDQLYPKIVSDGSGGAIITWDDLRNGNTDANTYAQRINSSGVVQWTANGVAISDTIRNQQSPAIASNGSGGAIIAWEDFRDIGASFNIYAQKINSSGVVQWTANGVALSNTTDYQFAPIIVSDGSGGAIITWGDFRDGGANANIYAQKVDSFGDVQWTSNGIAISTATGQEKFLTIVSDGSGGAIITWADGRQGGSYTNIYAQKVNSSGVVQWTANGVAISNTTSSIFPTSVSDGSGGAIITWADLRDVGSSYNIYAQKIDSAGVVKWTANGVDISTATYSQSHPTIISDGSGGAIITWQDFRDMGVYAQKIDSAGVVQWTVNGVAISTAIGVQATPTIVSDGSGGAIITWEDERGGGTFGDIYAQRINSSGVVQWTANGVAISTATGHQNTPTIESDGYGGAIITWGDKRGGSYSDIYAQQVSVNGNLGVVTGIAEEHGIAMGFALLQNYPNPFNPTTKIRFTLPDKARVTLRVYSILGQEVATIVNGKELTKGLYEYEFDGRNLSSGIYIYKIIAGNFLRSKKMIVLK